MRSLSAKFLVVVGIFAIAFSAFIFNRTWFMTSSHIKELTARQADLALEFDLAIRDYVAKNVRPVMEEMAGKDAFIPETMSTSFVARRIFNRVRKKFPDYIIKFSAQNPRNLTNRAGPEEIGIIEYFKKNPQAASWMGRITMDGLEYWAHFSPRRMNESCLRCHGSPEDAPASLITRYGAIAGFDRVVGDVALDTVAIPMAKVNLALKSEATKQLVTMALGLFFLFGAIFLAFQYVVTRRLVAITGHFRRAAKKEGKAPFSPVEVGGQDEITILASSFNTLADKLHLVHMSLEKRVEDRTAELARANEELQARIAEQQRTEEALKASEANYRAIFNAANDAIFVHDSATGEIIDVNEKMCEMFGYPQEDSRRITVGDISSGEYPYTQKDAMKWIGRAAGGEPQLFEWRCKKRSGELFWGEVSLKRAVIGGRERLLAVVRDISERKMAEEEKSRLESRLRRSQKMEAIGTLAGGVAHDLNNILSGIVSYPQLLLLDIPEESPLREPLLTIQESGKKAAVIVQDMLTLARRGLEVKEVVSFNEIISDYLKSPEYNKLISFHPDIRLDTELQDGLLNVLGSPVHLSKIVMNLVSNAAEAMPAGGEVTISTANRYIDSPIRGYDEVKEGDYVIISVSDTGIGISPEDIKRIFEPFYTKKVMGRSGTGLGMSVVWTTAKDHKGYIDVQSSEGEGTRFDLYFPVTRKEADREDRRISIEDYLGHEKILVIDDVEEQRKIVSKMLGKLGYDVTTVSSGEEAVDYLRENRADLLVLDMLMEPGIDGLETYRRIIELKPGQKAIIASGFSETERVKEAQRLGAGPYLKKPYTLEKLGLFVREELDK